MAIETVDRRDQQHAASKSLAWAPAPEPLAATWATFGSAVRSSASVGPSRAAAGAAPGRAEPPPAVRLLDRILFDAVEAGASDVHLEPTDEGLLVRCRVDGLLRHTGTVPGAHAVSVVSRLKVLSELDISQRRRPQDGRFTTSVAGRRVDVRVSVLPSMHGEAVVLRILDQSAAPLDLEALGFDQQDVAAIREAVAARQGLVLATGPIGSGKTTTLYAILRWLAGPDVSILTVEDPVEYRLPCVRQVQVDDRAGRPLPVALKSVFRQDPDVLMVGEIRDAATADVVAQAALTGHLVLSTMHAGDAPSAAIRLVNLGVEAHTVAAALRLVISQRLLRRRCVACAGAAVDARGAACRACRGTGLKGRTAVAEVMRVTEEIAGLIARGAPPATLLAAARRSGMRTLREAAAAKVSSGIVPKEEALRLSTPADQTGSAG